jgi:uncharacterized protein YbbK (DUF523 family)
MWWASQGYPIPFVSGLVYNSHMTTRCNMCMEELDYSDYVHVCPECLTDDYLMDLSVPSDTITL